MIRVIKRKSSKYLSEKGKSYCKKKPFFGMLSVIMSQIVNKKIQTEINVNHLKLAVHIAC